jgi:hypothetical protein
MKRYCIIFLYMIIIHGCIFEKKPDTTELFVTNNTKEPIFLLWSESDQIDSLQFPLFNWNVKPNSRECHFLKIEFINRFGKESHKIARLFIVNKTDVDKYGWNKIFSTNIYSKKYLISKDTLVSHNWEIVYSGK